MPILSTIALVRFALVIRHFAVIKETSCCLKHMLWGEGVLGTCEEEDISYLRASFYEI